MAIQLQIRRGTTSQNESFTGAQGELTFDTDRNELRVHDGSTVGGSVVSASSKSNIFDFKWSDHILDDIQWLRSDTFSWQDGELYNAAYGHLADDYDSIPRVLTQEVSFSSINTVYYFRDAERDVEGKAYPYAYTSFLETNIETIYCDTYNASIDDIFYTTPEGTTTFGTAIGAGQQSIRVPIIETISGITIKYYEAQDGHKIVLPDQALNVEAIYQAIGTAWYYVLDKENTQFKLPRVDPDNEKLVKFISAAVNLGSSNITYKVVGQDLTMVVDGGNVNPRAARFSGVSSLGSGTYNVDTSVSLGDSTVDLANATVELYYTGKKYLYFYVGSFPQKNIINIVDDNVANCITEIPQDIKFELNNGTLTLKAGSKVYVPNGVDVFDEITVTNDISVTTYSETGQTMVVIASDQSACYGNQSLNNWYSGTTPPSGGMFYNTSTNYIDYYSGGSITDGHFSFPLAIITVNNGSVTSIDQVFNGFGYIGSHVFALPGIRALIPNGRNESGTLKNLEIVSQRVEVYDFSDWVGPDALLINEQFYLRRWWNGDLRVDNYPAPAENCWYLVYDSKKNMYFQSSNGAPYYRTNYASVGTIELEDGRITKFSSKPAFHAVDMSEADYVIATKRQTSNSNGASWYRLYKSGWVEQGGYQNVSSTDTRTVTLPVAMKDTNYSLYCGLHRTTNSGGGHTSVGGYIVNKYQICLIGDYNDSGSASMSGCWWEVKGFAA